MTLEQALQPALEEVLQHGSVGKGGMGALLRGAASKGGMEALLCGAASKGGMGAMLHPSVDLLSTCLHV